MIDLWRIDQVLVSMGQDTQSFLIANRVFFIRQYTQQDSIQTDGQCGSLVE